MKTFIDVLRERMESNIVVHVTGYDEPVRAYIKKVYTDYVRIEFIQSPGGEHYVHFSAIQVSAE
jgi:hypothetical protein